MFMLSMMTSGNMWKCWMTAPSDSGKGQAAAPGSEQGGDRKQETGSGNGSAVRKGLQGRRRQCIIPVYLQEADDPALKRSENRYTYIRRLLNE